VANGDGNGGDGGGGDATARAPWSGVEGVNEKIGVNVISEIGDDDADDSRRAAGVRAAGERDSLSTARSSARTANCAELQSRES